MNKLYPLSALIFAIIFMAATFDTSLKMSVSQEAILNDSLILELPPTPNNYDIDFPDHIADFGISWSGDTIVHPALINDGIDDHVATLGRVLFYDNRLSSVGETSCSSCHLQEFSFASNLSADMGENGNILTRNTPNLNDIAWAIEDHLFWDLREDTLESMVLQPIMNPDELNGDIISIMQQMSETDFYPTLFESAFETSEITPDRMASALSQFIRSMSSFGSKFDQALDTDDWSHFTVIELNGKTIFEQDCQGCHAMPHFGFPATLSSGGTAPPFFIGMNNGLDLDCEDSGAGPIFNDPFADCTFRSPSMKNIAVTAPYMHDGRFATLDEVINFYSDSIQPHPNSFFQWTQDPSFTGFNYTDEEKTELKSFLLTLTDHDFLTDEKWANPFQTIDVSTANRDPEWLGGVSVRPNPSSGNFLIEFENPNHEQYFIQLATIDGKIILEDQTKDNQYRIDKTTLTKGIYMLHINNRTKIATEKIVVR